MAEIGLVASVFGVASIGTKLATSLYEAADIMIHAHQQITSIAKHVTGFTAVLRHLGRVLEADKASCSDGLLREIRKIKRSCKKTFKEINATITSRRFRPFVPVRWLFKHSKAKELEARLDSEQSMLQVMIHTVTVSKLGDMHSKMGDMHSKSKEGSEQISGLREEINVLKNLIIENHNNLTELQRAEQQSEVEARPPRSPEFPSRQAAEASRDDQQLPLHTDGNNVAYDNPTQTSSASSSETDKDDTESDAVVDGLRRTSSQGPRGDPNATLSHSDARVTEGDLKPAVQPSLAYKSTSGSETHRASSLLLQMIPYRPRAPGAYPTHPHLLTGAGPGVARQATDPKPMMEEVTNSVRLLLDKWTTSGSTPVSDVLVETASKDNPIWDSTGGAANEYYFPDVQPSRREPQWINNWSDDEFANVDYPQHQRPRIRREYTTHSNLRPSPSGINNVWKDCYDYDPIVAKQKGHEILRALRENVGGIVYTKISECCISHFVDDVKFYTHYLVPADLMTANDTVFLVTEIGKSWVRKEALDLLGYKYAETASGNFSFPRDLPFAAIEELIDLSYRAFTRGLEEHARQIIKGRGWVEAVESRQAVREAPSRQFRVYPATSYSRTDHDGPLPAFSRGTNSETEYESSANSSGEDRDKPRRKPSSPKTPNANSIRPPVEAKGAGQKPGADEARPVLPHMKPTRHTPVASNDRRFIFPRVEFAQGRAGVDEERRRNIHDRT